MSNTLYESAREGLLDETIGLKSGDIRVMLVKSSAQYRPGHRVLSDLGAADNGRSPPLEQKAFDKGVFGAAETSITAKAAVECKALVLYRHTGADSTARLIAWIDMPASGLPFTPAATQRIPIVWDTGPNRIFKLQ